MSPSDTHLSKFLSLVLRHKPDEVGISLDEAGWVSVSTLLQALAAHGHPITRADLDRVVSTNDKKRFAFSDDGLRIRASQGHSVEVELGYEPIDPPELLYHGTPLRFLPSIRAQGLLKGQRHHVHLSDNPATATAVGQRRGKPVILTVRSGDMHRAGHPFYRSANGVYLIDHVPPQFLTFPNDEVQP